LLEYGFALLGKVTGRHDTVEASEDS
jgi:hypothetical protein